MDRDYEVDQTVAVKDYCGNETKWILGMIRDKTGPVSYRVEVAPDVNWRRHADQIHDSQLHMKEGTVQLEGVFNFPPSLVGKKPSGRD